LTIGLSCERVIARSVVQISGVKVLLPGPGATGVARDSAFRIVGWPCSQGGKEVVVILLCDQPRLAPWMTSSTSVCAPLPRTMVSRFRRRSRPWTRPRSPVRRPGWHQGSGALCGPVPVTAGLGGRLVQEKSMHRQCQYRRRCSARLVCANPRL
jgi:hypothetical protein